MQGYDPVNQAQENGLLLGEWVEIQYGRSMEHYCECRQRTTCLRNGVPWPFNRPWWIWYLRMHMCNKLSRWF